MLAPNLQSLETIHRRWAKAAVGPKPDLTSGVDHARWFVCPTLTPLYYASCYQTLSEPQQKRYNQLTALCFNELIAFFEQSFAASVLAAISRLRPGQIDQSLKTCLQGFLRDEQQHIAYWRDLNRATAPQVYARGGPWILRFSPLATRSLRCLTAQPLRFPVVFWVMLALEERSLEISRRCLALDPAQMDPCYRAVYQHHLRDEVRHVELDHHLIERFYAPQPLYWRRWNARILRSLIGRYFLPPIRSAVRVVRRWVEQCPELAPRLPEFEQQLRWVGQNPKYVEMMYSRASTPQTFALFDRFEEMHGMQRVLASYRVAPLPIQVRAT